MAFNFFDTSLFGEPPVTIHNESNMPENGGFIYHQGIPVFIS
jgi:hypothetical protein